MKIIVLRLKNLHSLKGAFEIDFTQPAFSSAGIFAITGPTGAGKSTLLDAITLSLFGYTPRLGEISKSNIETNKILVTHGTNEAYAELVFEVNQKKYLANWSINKNRNKNWNDYKHALSQYSSDGEWKIITDKRTDVKSAIIDIIGLSKEQFSKAIVLSQGKFDEFLTAPAADRYKILEIITGTGLYRELGKKVYEKCKEVRDAYELQESKISQISLLSTDEIQSLSEQLAQWANEIEKLDIEINTITQQRDKRKALAEINESLQKLDVTLEKIKQEEVAQFPNVEKLENYEKAIRIKPLFTTWKLATQSAIDQDKKMEAARSNIQLFTEEREAYGNKLSTIVKKGVSKETFLIELDALITNIAGIQKEIDTIKAALESNKTNNKALIGTLPELYKETVIQKYKNSIQSLEAWVEEQKEINQRYLPNDVNPVTYLNNLITQQDAALDALKELRYPAETLPQLLAKKEALLAQQMQNEETHKKLLESDEALATLLQKESWELENLQVELKRFLEMNQLASIRKNLIAGQPCPCCGSTEHPFTSSMPTISSMIENQVAEKEKSLAAYKEKKSSTERDLHTSTLTWKNTTKELTDTADTLKNTLEQVAPILQKVGLTEIPSSINLKTEIDQRSNELRIAKSALLFAEKENTLLDIVTGAKLHVEKQLLLSKKEAECAIVTNGTSLDFLQNTLRNQWVVNETNISNAIDISDKLIREQNDIQLQIDTAQSRLQEAQLAAGFESMESFQLALVSDTEAEQWRLQQKDLERRKIAATTERNSLLEQKKSTIPLINSDYDQIDLPEKLFELSSQKTTIQENRGRVLQQLQANDAAKQNQQQMIAELNQLRERNELLLSMNSLIGDANGDKFNKIVQRITLRQLLALANARMDKLMPRYQLLMTESADKKEDSIWVVDLFMGSETRSINSVSGGERFVISLALAIALSDLASQNVRIDSLFIDEGFGSLSPDELNNAIQMLEKMQLEGNKMLGIISHVESLKERITSQLQIEKTAAGESSLYLSTPEQRISLRVTK